MQKTCVEIWFNENCFKYTLTVSTNLHNIRIYYLTTARKLYTEKNYAPNASVNNN